LVYKVDHEKITQQLAYNGIQGGVYGPELSSIIPEGVPLRHVANNLVARMAGINLSPSARIADEVLASS